MISQNMGFTILAEFEGKAVAGVVFFTHKDTIYYKFNASDEKYLQKRPNHLVTWEAIKFACVNNYRFFDFGRCAPQGTGLRTYKSRWGTREVNLPYYYYPRIRGPASIAEDGMLYRMARIFSHVTPQFLFKAAGSFFYRHLG